MKLPFDILILAMNLKEKGLVLFFTGGTSLETWSQVGMIDREIEIYKRLGKHVRKVSFVSYGGKDDLDYRKQLDDIGLLPVRWTRWISLNKALLFANYWRTLARADIFKTNQITGANIAILAKKLFRKKLIVRCGRLHSKFTAWETDDQIRIMAANNLELEAFVEADRGVVPTERDRQWVIDHHKIPAEKLWVIPNYVNTDVFQPQSTKKIYDLVCIARPTRQKNLHALFDALIELKQNDIKVKLLLLGTSCSDDSLREKAHTNQLKVTFGGSHPNYELPRYLNQAKTFILPSLYEGHPKVLLEAMSCGLSCIGTDVEGIREEIRHNKTGILCQTDSGSLAEAIHDLLSNERLCQYLGQNAQQFVLNEYSINHVLQLEIDLISEVLHL